MKNKAFIHRLQFALAGIRSAWILEKSLRTQSIFALGALAALFIFNPALIWWAVVGIMITLVLAAELFNTSLEHLIDHLHPQQHPAIKIAKDCAAGAVLVLSIGAVWVGVLMLIAVFRDL